MVDNPNGQVNKVRSYRLTTLDRGDYHRLLAHNGRVIYYPLYFDSKRGEDLHLFPHLGTILIKYLH